MVSQGDFLRCSSNYLRVTGCLKLEETEYFHIILHISIPPIYYSSPSRSGENLTGIRSDTGSMNRPVYHFLKLKKRQIRTGQSNGVSKTTFNADYQDNDVKKFIKEYLPYDSPDLRPVLINGFSRITLVGEEFKERITLDLNLSFAIPEGINSGFPYLAIAELKQEKRSSQSPFGLVMKKNGIHPGSFSKYCIGSALVKDMPRKNNLKQKLLIINKIENEYIKSNGT